MVVASHHAFTDLIEAARNLLDAHDRRAPSAKSVTENERMEISVLQIRLQEFFDVEGATG
jgi:hypothetical protein